MTDPRYPYRHHGPSVHGSKLTDYLISENSLRDDHPEMFPDMAQLPDDEPPGPPRWLGVLLVLAPLLWIGVGVIVWRALG